MKNKILQNKAVKIILGLILLAILMVATYLIYDIATVNKTYFKNERNIEIPIFTYHDIVNDESQIEFEYMQTTEDTFEKQISGLLKFGYKIISFDDLVQYNKGEKALTKKTCLITFDDGYTGVYENAYPIIKEYNIPAAVFVIDENVGTPGAFSWEQAKEMEENSQIKMYSHGLKHSHYDEETTETLVKETKQAYENLERHLGKRKHKVFAYPYGAYTEEHVKGLEKEGFIQNLMDNKINDSKHLNMSKLHREYPLSNPAWKIILKTKYRIIRYGA